MYKQRLCIWCQAFYLPTGQTQKYCTTCTTQRRADATLYTIYGLQDPQDRLFRYVGATRASSAGRLGGHLKCIPRHGTKKNAWVKGLQDRGLSPVLIELEHTDDSDQELVWISTLLAAGHPLLNVAHGKAGTKLQMSEATRNKITGITRSAATRERMSAFQRGRPKSEAHRLAIRKAMVAYAEKKQKEKQGGIQI